LLGCGTFTECVIYVEHLWVSGPAMRKQGVHHVAQASRAGRRV
jgi:hypothetical protein